MSEQTFILYGLANICDVKPMAMVRGPGPGRIQFEIRAAADTLQLVHAQLMNLSISAMLDGKHVKVLADRSEALPDGSGYLFAATVSECATSSMP